MKNILAASIFATFITVLATRVEAQSRPIPLPDSTITYHISGRDTTKTIVVSKSMTEKARLEMEQEEIDRRLRQNEKWLKLGAARTFLAGITVGCTAIITAVIFFGS